MLLTFANIQIYGNLFLNMILNFFHNWISTDGMIPFFYKMVFTDAQSLLTFISVIILIMTKSLKFGYAILFWFAVLRKKISLNLKSLKENIADMENEKDEN
jgi:hypothetical protein